MIRIEARVHQDGANLEHLPYDKLPVGTHLRARQLVVFRTERVEDGVVLGLIALFLPEFLAPGLTWSAGPMPHATTACPDAVEPVDDGGGGGPPKPARRGGG